MGRGLAFRVIGQRRPRPLLVWRCYHLLLGRWAPPTRAVGLPTGPTVDDDIYIYIYISCITLRSLNYANYGRFLILGRVFYHQPYVPI